MAYNLLDGVNIVKAIPNLLSILRIVLMPAFIVAYFSDDNDVKLLAIIIFSVASLTDFLDGYLARKLEATSNLGRILDPLGDKLMGISVLTCITIGGIIPVWALIIACVKELLMAIGGYVVHRVSKGAVPQSNLIGKASTVFFFLICVTLLVFPGIPSDAATVLITAVLAAMLIALASYTLTYIKYMKSR